MKGSANNCLSANRKVDFSFFEGDEWPNAQSRQEPTGAAEAPSVTIVPTMVVQGVIEEAK
ncbi:MAG: hypothetical protein ACREGJ_04955 [Candidatus Saccharimonadales bacterium]